MKKTAIAKLFAKKAKEEKKGLFITVQGWGKEETHSYDGLKMLPIKTTFPRA